jgi:maltose-binding protein MalE
MAHDWMGPFISTSYIQPLTLRLEKLQLLDPLAKNLFTFDGKLYGVPYKTQAVALYYNKRLVPEPPKTWNELKTLAKSLQETRAEYGFAVPPDGYHTYSILSGFGGYLFGRDSAGNYNVHDLGLDSPGAIRGAAEIAEMVRLGVLSPDMDYGTMVEKFRAGKLAMMITGPWELAPTVDSGISFGVARIPTMEKAPRPLVSADGFLLSARSQNLAAAKEFLLEFVPSDSIMQIIADTEIQFMRPGAAP